jgi:hypothetical protein
MFENTAQFQLHRRIVRELESGVNNRDWWVWIHFHVDEETDVSLVGLADEVERWLAQMNPDEQVAQAERVRELKWTGGGIHVELKAIPRGVASRGSPELVGNPFPAVAFWTGS